MIDIQEPSGHVYSEEEKSELSSRFLILLHTMLLAYLGIHNLVIPFIGNLLRGQSLLLDVHYWFLFHLPVQWMLRKGIKIPSGYILFLLIGSITRLIFEYQGAATLKSWAVVSILISELSSCIFYFVCWPHVKKHKLLPLALLGFLVPSLLSQIETQGITLSIASPIVETNEKIKDIGLGCKGDAGTLKFPLAKELPTREVSILDCGLSLNKIRYDGRLKVKNSLDHPVNMRLYRIKVLHGKVKWKFVRLAQIDGHSEWDISPHIKKDLIYLIKSSERRAIGHTVIVPLTTKEFTLGAGDFNFNYDSLEWISQ